MDDYNEDNEQSTSRNDENENHQIPSHFLVELTSLDELAFPANSTKRVKYTCVASTSRSLILGTSTGSVYIFSRYAAKSRSRVHSPVPVHVFTTRDGQINTISMSSSEELMAIGGDSGRVSVAQMNNGQPPTLIYTIPGDARAPDRVNALTWSCDNKLVYSGHLSGNILVHRLGSRSVFRASHQKLTKFDGEIVQMDLYNDHIVVSTTIAAYLYNIENGSNQQIGKKARSTPARLGACYVNPGGFIIAARPNGRLWESNLVGVVYKTHQFRQCKTIPRAPPVSFRNSFPIDCRMFEGIHPHNQDVMLNILHVFVVDGKTLVLSAFGGRICIVDLDSSKIILIAELENDILDISTCSNDIFLLLSDSKGLRKFSLFERNKAIEKLQLKSLFLQCAQLIQFCWPFVEVSAESVKKTIEGLASMSKKKETENLQNALNRILETIVEKKKNVESTYDNLEDKKLWEKMASGVHKVLRNAQESGYDDDFSFHTPQALRERSRSSPCSTGKDEKSPVISKRGSEPSNMEMKQEWRKNGTPDVVEEDILNRARNLLDADGRIIEKESLRTLLQLEEIKKEEIRFTPTVTIGNAAKALAELALAVPVDVSTIWKNNEIEDETETEGDSGMESGRIEKKKPKNKATIVKVIRPGVKPKPAAVETTRKVSMEEGTKDLVNNRISENETRKKEKEIKELDAVAEEMKMKQDELWLDLRLNHIKKQNMEDIKKSDTDYTITTNDSDITPSVDSVEVWTNPLNDLLTPTKSEKSKSHCEECRMHRSWASLSLLMSVCNQADVLIDDFDDGGVPSNIEQWEKIINYVAQQEEEEIEKYEICPRCETALNNVEKVIADGWRKIGTVSDDLKPNVEKIHERCSKLPEEKLKIIISRKYEIEKLDNQNDETTNRINKKDNSQRNSCNLEINDTKPVEKKEINKNQKLNEYVWKWTKGVKMKTILKMATFCLGKKSILELIKRNDKKIAKMMKADDWSMLVVMSSRELAFKNLISQKTIENILSSVGANEWVVPKRKIGGNSISTNRKGSNTSSMTSWIVDANGKCPICTLSIKMIVGGIDRGIISYSCGHVYHKMCLSGRNPVGCIACRVRARRAVAAARQSGIASPSAGRSPILGARMVK